MEDDEGMYDLLYIVSNSMLTKVVDSVRESVGAMLQCM